MALNNPNMTAGPPAVGPTDDGLNIRVVESHELIRRRSSMFTSGTDATGLHHMVFELVGHSIDEATAGHCSKIEVTVHADGSASVVDDGRGIPVGPCRQFPGKSSLEIALTKLHA